MAIQRIVSAIITTINEIFLKWQKAFSLSVWGFSWAVVCDSRSWLSETHWLIHNELSVSDRFCLVCSDKQEQFYPTQLFTNKGYSSNLMQIVCIIFLLNKNH